VSVPGTRPSAIARIRALLSQPAHHYRPATTVFLDLNVDRVADEFGLAVLGGERGAENRPTSDAQTMDDVEHKIVERIEAHKQDANVIYLDQLHTYDERMNALSFEERFATIQQAAPEAVGDFRAEATVGRDELFVLRRRLNESELEREQFRKHHRIERPARLASPGKIVLKAGILAILFRPGRTCIFGFGASSDVPLVMAEDGLFDDGRIGDYQFTTEHGPFGGIVMSGWQFSANIGPEALLDGVQQFDFIDGGNCPFAALAFAQFDREGNVNVSWFGSSNPGAGGFIDIAQNAKDLVFTGTFTTAGLNVSISDGGLRVAKEGSVQKFVDRAEQITYPVRKGVVERGQSALIVTERAVFRVVPEGLVLTEVANGIDVRRDILDQMAFAPHHIVDPLPLMDASLFAEYPVITTDTEARKAVGSV
jgi:acyl CoA:acetate/3-ketoacid CoA transferase